MSAPAPPDAPAPGALFDPALPDLAAVVHDEALAALLAGDARAALPRLLRAADLAPSSGVVRYHLALALRLLGDLPGALAAMREAVASLPGRAAPQCQLGALLHLRNDLTGAIACYRTALALEPEHAIAAYHLAVALVAAGHEREAGERLRQALALPLPPLVAERARGQLAELALPGAAKAFSLCAAPMVTEFLGPLSTAASPPAASPPAASPPAVAPVAVTPGALPRVVALTGAGMSVESGLRTRKDLWRRFQRDDAVALWKFREDPTVLWGVVADFLGAGGHRPGEAHRALARVPGLRGVITQNVDGLHQQAHREEHGREAPYPIVEFHGTLARTLCHGCGRSEGRPAEAYLAGPLPPRCAGCGGVIRPDVVLFGERVAPADAAEALRLVASCDLLLVIGCAMDVAPASELPRVARDHGARVVEFKRQPSRLGRTLETALIQGESSLTVPAFLARVLAEGGDGNQGY